MTANTINAWQQNAERLAEWWFQNAANRQDAWGSYLPLVRRKERVKADGTIAVDRQRTSPPREYRGKVLLTPGILARHFRAQDLGHICGLHSTGPDNLARWVAIDLDAHSAGDSADRNYWFAVTLHDTLVSLGFSPWLFDSDGKGGYHLWLIFAQPVRSADAYRFGRWLVRDALAHGYTTRPESFPKQPELTPGQLEFGNWLRIVGAHHTRPHWSKMWGGEAWLDDAGTVARILSNEHLNNEACLIPGEALAEPIAPPPAPKPARPPQRGNRMDDRTVALKALDGMSPSRADHYESWLRVGAALHHVDPSAAMLAEWDAWSRKSSKYCAGDCEDKWPTFRRSAGNVATVATLVFFAKQDGANIFPKRSETPIIARNATATMLAPRFTRRARRQFASTH